MAKHLVKFIRISGDSIDYEANFAGVYFKIYHCTSSKNAFALIARRISDEKDLYPPFGLIWTTFRSARMQADIIAENEIKAAEPPLQIGG